MIEKVCSGIFMSLHVRGLHFAISVHTRLRPSALCCRMSEQPARTCSVPQLTCGVPGELQQAGNTGKMTWGGRILANWVHSRILFLAAWCPLCGLCKILCRPSPAGPTWPQSLTLWARSRHSRSYWLSVPGMPSSRPAHGIVGSVEMTTSTMQIAAFFKTEVKSYFLLEALSDFRMQG